jgi:[acyl-carrier-protein] S-malonyltransferase
MGRDVAEAFAEARHTFEEADDILNTRLSTIIFEGPDSLLTETRHSQLAIWVVSAAWVRVLRKQLPGIEPVVSAGLSLGEYTALWASGRLGFRETLLLVRERAAAMHAACEATEGAMSAVLGCDGPQVEAALQGLEGVWIANYNCPGQVVISGTRMGVAAATAPLKEAGAKRVIPLTVHGAFHSPLMRPAQLALAPAVEQAPICSSETLFAMNATGGFVSDPTEVKRYLIEQVVAPVRWEQSIRTIGEAGVDLRIEMGCGKTLTGMNRKIGGEAENLSLEKVDELDGVVRAIEEAACAR